MTDAYVGERAATGATCAWSPTPDDPPCGRPATRHVAVYSPPHEQVVGLPACEHHEADARAAGRVYGMHDWTPACGGARVRWVQPERGGPSWCEPEPVGRGSVVHPYEVAGYPTASHPPQTCARCGHRSQGCPHCPRLDPTLGGQIEGRRYCHTWGAAALVLHAHAALRERGPVSREGAEGEQPAWPCSTFRLIERELGLTPASSAAPTETGHVSDVIPLTNPSHSEAPGHDQL